MKFPIPVLTLAFLAISAVCAQDITGRWIGVAQTTDESGANRMERQTLEIKTEDGKLTGILVSRSGKGGIPFQIQQDEGKFNLLGFLPLDGGEHLRWKFEFKNGNLVGTFSAMHDNPKKWKYDRIGSMTVTKAPPPAATESK